MTRSLVFRLVLAFLVVSITGAVLTALFARWATFQEFDRLVLEQAQNNFLASATAYYQTNGSWLGVREYFHRLAAAPVTQPRPAQQLPPPPQPEDRNRPVQQPQTYVFALVDQDGYVVLPAGPYRLGHRILSDELAEGIVIEVDGQVVGTALVTGEPPPLAQREVRYLIRTNQASLYAALAAITIALFLGIFLARRLTRPVRELTAATRAMANGELEQRVPIRSEDELGELATSFNQMSADLARANELRRQMTADIAHDLRTPLSVIAGYAEGLRDGVLPPTPETFQTIHEEANHLSRLVEDLRTLSLADAGELTLIRQLVPPRELLERTAAAHLPRAQQLGIDLQVTAEAKLPPVNVDPERLAQVLGNLVSNALRHTPVGGQISLAAAQEGDDVLLTVQDTGVGIASSKLPRIFDRFYRGDVARQADEGESGLGLAIAKSLVELHGGMISVESILEEGTTFTIALPVGS
jgi:two-component system sensor histidine kinase BaeS